MKLILPPSLVAVRRVPNTITFSNSSGTVTVFTITGRVLLTALTAYVTASVIEDGAVASIELGGATDPNALIEQTNPSLLVANTWWTNNTPIGGMDQMNASQIDVVIDEDIILTITGGTDLDSGAIRFVGWYLPETDNGRLSAA